MWVFSDPAGALELLELLPTADAPCLWPKGEPLKIVALHHHKRDLAERLLEGADAPARLDAGELLRQPIA